ncbi:3485_t:CDS:1, partial [Gigaspora rosea]
MGTAISKRDTLNIMRLIDEEEMRKIRQFSGGEITQEAFSSALQEMKLLKDRALELMIKIKNFECDMQEELRDITERISCISLKDEIIEGSGSRIE